MILIYIFVALSTTGFRSLDDVVVFFFNEGLEGPVTDGTHGVVGDSRDEDGEQLILT